MGVRITLSLAGRSLETYEFDRFELIRVGRHEDCEVRIENLGISRFHCEIRDHEGLYQLRDLGSDNGTYVNEKKVSSHNLNSGDVISIGKFTLDFACDQPGFVSIDKSFPVGATLTSGMDPEQLAKLQRQQASGVRGYLIQGNGDSLPLNEPFLVFGKGADADVPIGGAFAPRVAVVLVRDDTGFQVMDVSPKGNCLTVNGAQLRSTRLGDDDEVAIRGIRMTFKAGVPDKGVGR